MANLRENAAWESGIYQLETTDPVVGGVDGISNKQAIQLANRTSYLKGEIESLKSNSNAQLVLKRDISDSYSKGEVNALLAPKLDTVAAEAAYMKKTDASSFLQTTQRALISEYAHAANGQTLPDGDYSSPDFWFSIRPGIYYAVSEKGKNKPAAYGLVEIVSNGEVSITWNYWGEVWKWYQTFGKNNSGWKKVVLGDATSAAQANSIVARDGNADFEARYVVATSFKSTANVDDARINAQSEIMFRDPSDKFLRPATIEKFKEVLELHKLFRLDCRNATSVYTASQANPTIDLSKADNFELTLTGSGVLTLNNGIKGQSGVIAISNAAANITGYASNIRWRTTPTSLQATETFAYFVWHDGYISIGRV